MTKHKICTKCNLPKEFNFFYKNSKSKDGIRSSCIECQKKYLEDNKEKVKEQNQQYNQKRRDQKKKWSELNKEKVNFSRKKWLDSNKEIRAEYVKEYNKQYYIDNKKIRSDYSNQKQKEYRKTNPLFKVKSNLRRRINRYIKNKSKSTEEIIGISYTEFLKYLGSKFTKGMTIENLGNDIHIDHIIPLSSAKSEEELYKLCHYTNLQPLWAKDNLTKSDKII
jgi:hypothetical protein